MDQLSRLRGPRNNPVSARLVSEVASLAASSGHFPWVSSGDLGAWLGLVTACRYRCWRRASPTAESRATPDADARSAGRRRRLPGRRPGWRVCPINFCGSPNPVARRRRPGRAGAPTSLCNQVADLPGDRGRRQRNALRSVVLVAARRRAGLRRRLLNGSGSSLRCQDDSLHRGARRAGCPLLHDAVPQRRRLRPGVGLPRVPAAPGSTSYALVGSARPRCKMTARPLPGRAGLPGGAGVPARRRSNRAAPVQGRRLQVDGRALHRPGAVPQRRVLRPRLPHRQRQLARILLGRLHQEQRLRRRPALRRQGAGQQRHHLRSARRRRRRLLPQPVRFADLRRLPERHRMHHPGEGRRHLPPDLWHLLQAHGGDRRPVRQRRGLRPGGPAPSGRPSPAAPAC